MTDVPDMRTRFNLRVAAPRLPALIVGLLLFGAGIALMVEAGLGLGPWEALHQGIARHTGLEIGTVSVLLGIPILALWWPLGERPGIGTLLNVAIIGASTNLVIALLPTPAEDATAVRLAVMLAGVIVIALGSGIYLSTDLGPGPRDGLMTGVHHRFGWSIRRARTAVELSVLGLGWALGGTVGIGTMVFALGIGPLVQVALRAFDREGRLGRWRRARLEQEGVIGD
ncbi:MAG: membrane protein YczE [Candidatus Limnocylindrales bacterium]